MAGRCGHGCGQGPGKGRGNGNPKAPPLDTSSAKQRARVNKRWAAHRARVAEGAHAVELHRRMLVLQKAKKELRTLMRSIQLPPRACPEETDR
jgi:hypothetical protein